MSEQPLAGQPAADDSAAIPYEAIPALAANEDYIAKMERLRELKALKDALFNDKEPKKPGDLPLGEYTGLKLEVAAMNLVNGYTSVVYNDLRVARVAGGTDKGKVTGAAMIEQYEAGSDLPMPYELLRAIALAAKDCDVQVLVEHGMQPARVMAARTPDKPRSASIRVEWVGAKGKGAGQKARATGGPIQ